MAIRWPLGRPPNARGDIWHLPPRPKTKTKTKTKNKALTCKGRPRGKKNATSLPTYLFLRFFEIFWSGFRKYFCGVLGLLMQRNGQKRD
jgi:hypothetical protein